MPAEIQARIARTIDEAIDNRITPELHQVRTEVLGRLGVQDVSLDALRDSLGHADKSNRTERQRHVDVITKQMEEQFDALSLAQARCFDTASTNTTRINATCHAVEQSVVQSQELSISTQKEVRDLATYQRKSTQTVLQSVVEVGHKTVHAIEIQNATARKSNSSLHRKIDCMNLLMVAAHERYTGLPEVKGSALVQTTNPEIQAALSNIQQSLWVLMAALHAIIRELL